MIIFNIVVRAQLHKENQHSQEGANTDNFGGGRIYLHWKCISQSSNTQPLFQILVKQSDGQQCQFILQHLFFPQKCILEMPANFKTSIQYSLLLASKPIHCKKLCIKAYIHISLDGWGFTATMHCVVSEVQNDNQYHQLCGGLLFCIQT